MRPTIEPIASSLTDQQYFGVVGVDILVTQDGNQYVLDINPRYNASTPLLLASKMMKKKGWQVGVFVKYVEILGSEKEVIFYCNEVELGEIVISSMVPVGNKCRCQLFIFSDSIDSCVTILNDVIV